MKKTGVKFRTDDRVLQKIFDGAEKVCLGNIMDYDGRTVLVEGGGYLSMWPETQPMAGEMYAKRKPLYESFRDIAIDNSAATDSAAERIWSDFNENTSD